jgi:hypothetical protein
LQNAVLSVVARVATAADNTVLIYRWLRNGVALDGDSQFGFPFNATLVIPAPVVAAHDAYACLVQRYCSLC